MTVEERENRLKAVIEELLILQTTTPEEENVFGYARGYCLIFADSTPAADQPGTACLELTCSLMGSENALVAGVSQLFQTESGDGSLGSNFQNMIRLGMTRAKMEQLAEVLSRFTKTHDKQK